MTGRRLRNRSAACGAWEHRETGRHAHESCTGRVNLPAPDDECSCPCHAGEHPDPGPLDDPEHVARATARHPDVEWTDPETGQHHLRGR